MKKIKKYKVGIDSETYAVSLVESPAIEETFVYMNDEENKMKVLLDSDEKYMVYGAILVPSKPIYRVADDGTEFYIEFTKESIEKMSQEYLINYRQHSVTLDHEEEATEVCLVESWLKTSPTLDKSIALGLNAELPIGTWIGGFKVNNIDTWNRIKNGELNGFSVEAMIDLENYEFAKQIEEMSIDKLKEMGLFDEIKQAFKEALQEEKLSRQPKEATVEELQKEFENVDENIKVEEVALEEQVASVTEVIETPKVEEPQVTVEEVVVEETPKVEEPKSDEPNPLNELVNNLKSEIDALRKMNDDLQHKIDDMGKQPSTTPINTNVSNASHTNDSYKNWRSQMQKML